MEAVLDLAAEAGVDDVHIIAALGLHRRMHEYELRHALGSRIYDAFHPRGTLYQHDAEDLDNLAVIGTTPEGEVLEINKRAADSDLIVYVNINSVAMDGGWKSITTGLASYRSLSHHHNPETLENTKSLMGDRSHERAAQERVATGQDPSRPWAEGVPDRDHAEHRHVPVTLRLPLQARVGVESEGQGNLPGHHQVAQPHADAAGPQDLPQHRGPAPDDRCAGRRHRGGAQADRSRWSTSSNWSRCTARPTSSPWASPTCAPTTQTGS